jgi:hypothetical protein
MVTMALGAQAQIPFTKTPVDTEFGAGRPFDIAVGLIDGDAEIDFVANVVDDSGTEDYISWYENLNPGFSETVFDNLDGNTSCLAVADLDSDLDNDIVLCTHAETFWYENDGNGNFTRDLLDPLDAVYRIVVNDLNDDTYQDVVAQTPYEIFWAMNDGSENFTHLPIDSHPIVDKALAVTDLDDDLDKDIVASIFVDSESHIVWYENDGSELFTRTPIDTLSGLSDITDLVVADLDEDGDKDLVFTLSATNQIFWLENDGSEDFTIEPIASDFMQAPRGVVVVDIDNDMDNDLLVVGGNSAVGEVVYYENDGSEVFLKRIIDDTPGNRLNLAAIDLDSDGDTDFLVVNNYPHEISYFRNELIPTAVSEQTTDKFSLQHVFPNPFNPQTTVTFALGRPRHVTIAIFDLTGRLVTMLADRGFGAGTHSATWRGKDELGQMVPSGPYVVRMEAGNIVDAQKITLVR